MSSSQEQHLKDITVRDSVLLQETQQRDSAIMAYIHDLNDIEDNLNAIKTKENVITINDEKNANKSQSDVILGDIKSLDALIIKNNREIADLEKKLKSSNKKDVELNRMVQNLTADLNEKIKEVAMLEAGLAKANDSIKLVLGQFRDSLAINSQQRGQINTMRTEMNMVYYAFGTYKELKKQGILVKEGAIIGVGGAPTLKPDFNTGYFTTASIQDLHSIPLYAKFQKVVTNHPATSYKITGNGKADSFVITDPAAFWSTGKYLVILVNGAGNYKAGGGSRSEASISPGPSQ